MQNENSKKMLQVDHLKIPRKEKDKMEDQDKELNDLIVNSKIIEACAAQELFGRERQKYQRTKLVELGMKPLKPEPVTRKDRIRIMKRKREEKEEAMQEVRQRGLYHRSLKSTFKRGAEKILGIGKGNSNTAISFAQMRLEKKPQHKKQKQNDLFGKFKNGMLKLTKNQIQKINS